MMPKTIETKFYVKTQRKYRTDLTAECELKGLRSNAGSKVIVQAACDFVINKNANRSKFVGEMILIGVQREIVTTEIKTYDLK